jgi:tripartite-type tricarboxylate transporter receptor subunit TctC
VASWNALAAPAGTPPEVVERLGRAAREAVAAPAVREKLAALGVRMQSSTPAEMQALLQSEIRRWGEVIRKAGIEPE